MAIVNQYAVPPSMAGGIRHHGFAKSLETDGHPTTIFAGTYHHLKSEHPELGRRSVEEGVSYEWIDTPSYRGNGIGRIVNMQAFARRVVRPLREFEPDVVLVSTPHLFAASTVGRACRMAGIPFILEVRDLWPQSLVDLRIMHSWHPLVLEMRSAERRAYRDASGIIAIPQFAAQYIEPLAGGKRVTWIPNGIDPDDVPAPRRPEPAGEFRVLYAGSHGPSDSLNSVLDAASTMTRERDAVQFTLIGRGTDKDRLVARAAREGTTNLRFLDPVPRRHLHKMMSDYDAFVVNVDDSPLYRYGMSFNKFYDYLALARPTIIGTNSETNPFALSGAGLTVPSNDPAALAEAVRRLARMDVDERWKMGLRGRAYVEEHHDSRQLAARMVSVLRAAVVSSDPPGDLTSNIPRTGWS